MEKNLSEYISLSKNIDELKFDKKIKVGILSSFTLNGLDETLHVKTSELGIRYQSYVSGYNQYNQQFLDPESDLYNFSPDITFLILDTRNFFGDSFYFSYNMSETERKSLFEEKFSQLKNLIEIFQTNSNSKLIIALKPQRYSFARLWLGLDSCPG